MTTASDNFNRANETPVAAPWTATVGSGARLASNQLTSAAASYGIARYASGTWANDQQVEATVASVSGDATWAFICTRLDSSGNGWSLSTDGLSGNTGFSKFTNGSEGWLMGIGVAFAVGDRMRLKVEGQSPNIVLTAYKQTGGAGDWVQVGQVTGQSGSNAGVPGGGAYSTAAIDDWSATDELGGGGGGTKAPPPHNHGRNQAAMIAH